MSSKPDKVLDEILRSCVKQRFPNLEQQSGNFFLFEREKLFSLDSFMAFKDKRTNLLIPKLYMVFRYFILRQYTDEMKAYTKFTIEDYKLLPASSWGTIPTSPVRIRRRF